ncbi:hypothetical protein PRIPAC_84743, partial [Pristionchus pacificus]|uniref:Transp_Tc5_C domain-containing protein n=1 Tax=Pristionchus pacificus TaxID=54126 RepID=A0A2A6BDD1_PRIPA
IWEYKKADQSRSSDVSATQHSFTILPIIKADGTLGEQLYVVLQEPGGRFPQKGHVKLDNLIVRAASTHIMTKSLMLDWFKECVAHPFSPTVSCTPGKEINDSDSDSNDSAHIFRPMLEYHWKKAGYIYSVIPNFKTPVQICFPPGIDSTTCHTSSCAEDSFIPCPHCNRSYCFGCYFIKYHKC